MFFYVGQVLQGPAASASRVLSREPDRGQMRGMKTKTVFSPVLSAIFSGGILSRKVPRCTFGTFVPWVSLQSPLVTAGHTEHRSQAWPKLKL